MTMPSLPSFSAECSTQQTWADDTPVLISWDDNTVSNTGFVYNGTSDSVTVQTAGLYLVSCEFRIGTGTFTTNAVVGLYIYVNGVIKGQLQESNSDTSVVTVLNFYYLNEFASGDVLTFRGLQHASTPTANLSFTPAYSYLNIQMLDGIL